MDRYQIRINRHKFNQKLVASVLKRIALRIIKISNLNAVDDEGVYRDLEITYYPDGWDNYPSCKSWEKGYCGAKRNKYVLYISGYSFYGSTLSEMYSHVIGRLLLDPIQFPFCTSKILPHKLKISYHIFDNQNRRMYVTDKEFNIISKIEKGDK